MSDVGAGTILLTPRRGPKEPMEMQLCADFETAPDTPPRAPGCEECLVLGTPWVHLRTCLACGHVGCCDSSPGRHATAHYRTVAHPVVRSAEPGENWRWCYVHELLA
jgi:Zn-finger in ubiquitin-hydrolases and other protein